MARVVSRGATLDPLVIAAFGAQWVLIDGHHRRAAYKQAGYGEAVPVVVEDSPLGGVERARWAVMLSVALNSKNKLAMSGEDKFDAAWRLVVEAEDALSKKQLMDATGVADGTIGNMRRVSSALGEAGHRPLARRAMSWARARFEYRCLKGDVGQPDPEAQEKRLRLLTKKLSPIINGRLSAMLLLEAMEGLRPGISVELETAIGMAKDREAAEGPDWTERLAPAEPLDV
jgi:hypothetical protein